MNPDDLRPEERERYEERAAIIEYLGNVPRHVAEREAMKETLKKRKEKQ